MKLFLSRTASGDGYVFRTKDRSFSIEVMDYYIVNGYYHLVDKEVMMAPPLLVRKDCVENLIKFKEAPEFILKRVEDNRGFSVFRINSKNTHNEYHHVTLDKTSNQIFCDFDCEGWQFNNKCYHTSAVMSYLGMGPKRQPINVKNRRE